MRQALNMHVEFNYRYFEDEVENHTDKLLERYEKLVNRVMESDEMNHVYVLPQLHTLLWSNKKGV